jgi:hypothetical protein
MSVNPSDELRLLERRRQAAHLKYVVGLTWDDVAKQLGYSSGAVVNSDVLKHLKAERNKTAKVLEDLVAQQDMRYDTLRRKAYAIMVADHPFVQGGKIVKDDEGRPLKDVGPQLAAMATLLRIESQWSDLHGTNASKKLEIALVERTDVESNLVAEAILAAADALQLPPEQRMRALEAAAARLEIVDAEVVEDE